ncbi:hypothetical protein LOTGIDRAFT_228022 [Lottia gigantea]|uniref:Vitelline envelope sperm lysin receptor C-terminal domain-containing protein n=1 Tax=Lottia gigantea TaxID=225164 RepID=V4BHT9_LOTGI|nr:hypothetical protein LOTGIDRAFT_228022 [Lottia gigantea]ESP05437.1 hypothetical protein LOTGIDRAFT_228022 [Lottia gigantea]
MLFNFTIDKQVKQQWSHHLVLAILIQMVTVAQSFPENSVLQITADCSSLNDNAPVITVISDLNISPSAWCVNSEVPVSFTTDDDVHYKLRGTFTVTTNTSICQFYKRNNVDIYAIKIIVPWGEDNSHVHTHKEKKVVTCVFGDYGTEQTEETDLRKSDMAPKQIMVNTGNKLADGEFDLEVINVLREPYVGAIPQGRKVALKATATNAAGLHVIGCEAKPSSDSSIGYSIIRAGCGDGRIIKNDRGFVTTGAVAISPFFEMFQMDFYTTIQFHCNVTACDEECNGNSCALVASRRKRATDVQVVTVKSNDVKIISDKEN